MKKSGDTRWGNLLNQMCEMYIRDDLKRENIINLSFGLYIKYEKRKLT